MDTKLIDQTFFDVLKRLGGNFTETILYLSRPKVLDLNISLHDIPQARSDETRTFDFLKEIEQTYPVETITATEFMFLIASLAYRYHSESTIFDQNDVKCTEYLKSIWSTVRKKFGVSGARLDFYKWFINQYHKVK